MGNLQGSLFQSSKELGNPSRERKNTVRVSDAVADLLTNLTEGNLSIRSRAKRGKGG